ncbi:MAG: glutamate racemase [Rikenellaceae bacterium]|jgi:glutamate racemase|nr:glutamate racemase [Rikenellaceae bacterium]
MNNNPIGVLDSGVGGLSVLRELRAQLPAESLYYYGDGLNCPYGSKPLWKVEKYVDKGVRQLKKHSIKMLVVACNSGTAAAIDFLRNRYDFPIVGMEPAVKPAAIATRSGVIGVLATANTLAGELYRTTAARYADRVRIVPCVGTGFVELVEGDREGTPEALEAVRRVVEPLLERGADQLVLGCTHYPFLAADIRAVIASRAVDLVDPAPAIVRRVRSLLEEHDLVAQPGYTPLYRFFTAADDHYRKMLRRKSGFFDQ